VQEKPVPDVTSAQEVVSQVQVLRGEVAKAEPETSWFYVSIVEHLAQLRYLNWNSEKLDKICNVIYYLEDIVSYTL
jgi:hypothetical protein